MEDLLRASLTVARKAGMAKPEDFQQAVLDTPVYRTPRGVLPIAAEAALGDGALVQTKAVTPPTDGKLLYAMHARLLREAKARAIAVPRPGRREMLHA